MHSQAAATSPSHFRITGLAPSEFAPLFERDDDELARLGIARRVVDECPGYPCRISLQYAPVGETVLLLPYEHLSTRSPYRAAGPIYVRRDVARFDAVDTLPDVLRRAKLLSVRGYDEADLMIEAEVARPDAIEATLQTLLANPRVAYLHVHNARPGCFSCRVERVAGSSAS